MQSNFSSYLTKTQQNLTKHYGVRGVSRAQVFRWRKAFLDGRESVKDEPCSGRPCTSKTDENVTKVRALVRSDRRLTVRMICTIMRSLNNSEKGFIVSGQRLWTLGCHIMTTLPVTLPSPWTNFWPKRVFQWFCSPHTHLTWVCVTYSFSQNSNSTSKVIILELWTTSKRLWQSSWGHFHMKTSSTATGSGSNVSGSVWLPKGTILKGIMLIYSSVVNKNFITPVSLLFRHTLYTLQLLM